jgi:hypothetical protein
VLTVKPVTVIGDVPVAVMPPGLDVAVYVTAVGNPVLPAVNATEADVVVNVVAVPIVGAAGLAGQTPEPMACICCLDVQIPEKLGITSFLYLLMGSYEWCRAK